MSLFLQGADWVVFVRYTTIVVGLLAVAGGVLGFLDRVLHKNVTSVWRIYRGWLMIIPTVLLFVGLGRVAFILGVLGLSVMGFREFARATGLTESRWIMRVVYASMVVLAVLALVPVPNSPYYGWYGLFVVLPVYVVGLVLLVPILQNRYEGRLQAVALGILGFLYFGWLLGHFSFLANSPHFVPFVLYLVFATQVADIAAYTFGRLFGRHKLRSNISPNKTVEGSLAALAVSLALPWLLQPLLPQLTPGLRVLTGLIVGVASQLGDLSISLIKRDVGLKDMGTLLPGHGGVLDRVDSLILVTPLFFHMTRYFGILFP